MNTHRGLAIGGQRYRGFLWLRWVSLGVFLAVVKRCLPGYGTTWWSSRLCLPSQADRPAANPQPSISSPMLQVFIEAGS